MFVTVSKPDIIFSEIVEPEDGKGLLCLSQWTTLCHNSCLHHLPQPEGSDPPCWGLPCVQLAQPGPCFLPPLLGLDSSEVLMGMLLPCLVHSCLPPGIRSLRGLRIRPHLPLFLFLYQFVPEDLHKLNLYKNMQISKTFFVTLW